MSHIVKFFIKSKKTSNKENLPAIKCEEESFAAPSHNETFHEQYRPIPNPYSIWTAPKASKGPQSCPGGDRQERHDRSERRRGSRNLSIFDENEHISVHERRCRKLEAHVSFLTIERREMREALRKLNDQIEYANMKLHNFQKANSKLKRELLFEREQSNTLRELLEAERDRVMELESQNEGGAEDELASSSQRSLDSCEANDEIRIFRKMESPEIARGSEDQYEFSLGTLASDTPLPIPSPSTHKPPKEVFIRSTSLETSDTSEDDIRIRERQLRKKSDGVVRFNPPRQSIQNKHYRRFGKSERTALNNFNFLENEITDVSGLLSSPDAKSSH